LKTPHSTSGYVGERIYLDWKQSKSSYPSSWSADVSGPDILKVSEQDYLKLDYNQDVRNEIYIFCKFIMDLSKLQNPERYLARRKRFGME